MNEVTTTNQEAKEVATQDLGAWGNQEVSSQEIVIPKILAMQGLSQMVLDQEAAFGDLMNSMTKEKLGDLKNPVTFIPFHRESVWVISRKVEGAWKFDSIEPITHENEGYKFEEVRNGVAYKNERTLNFYCLLPKDMSLPMVVSFKGMSRKQGNILNTIMYVQNRAQGKVPPAKTMELYGVKDSNEKGTYVVLKSKVVRDTTMEEIQACLEWYKIITSGRATVQQEEEPADTNVYADTEGQPQF